MTTRNEVGRYGEDVAVSYLRDVGFCIVERNWRCPEGEVDIVAVDGDDVVIVEVKTRRGHAAGHPLEAVTPEKLARLRRLAAAWVQGHPSRERGLRIDVIGVTTGRPEGDSIHHIEGVGA
jgi:putative endonuclease